MSGQKVWVEKMPEYCDECPCSLRGKDDCAYCNLLHKNIGYDFGKRPKHCPLHSIKDHDRELVKQVCEKIEDWCDKNFNWIDTLKSEKENLERTLEESAERIEELEGQFAYECECNKQFVSLQNKWQKLKEFLNEDKLFDYFKEDFVDGYKNCLLSIKNKMQELEADEFEWFVMLDLLTDNEKNMHILDLHRQLAELKEKAIIPRFKADDYVYALYADKNIYKGKIDVFDYYSHKYLVFFDVDIGCDWFFENRLFKTKKEAQVKLKEIKGNE